MFRINDVYNNQGERYRILSLLSKNIVWIDIDKGSALPALISYKELANLIEEKVCYLVDDPYQDLILQNPEDGSTAQLKRDSNYELIKPIVSHHLYYLPAERAKPINEIIQSNQSTKQTLYRLLRRYWQRGQTPNTLLPSYKNSGAKGKKRTARNKKLGRPRVHKEGSGAIINIEPYSVRWIGSDDPTLINDERFAPAGVLAPKSKADFAFVLHALNYLSSKGRAAIVCFPGIFYRGGAEKKIREYLIDNNYVESVISLAPNLFFGTSISVNILVLSKHKTDNKTQFIDASKLFKAETNTNILTEANIEQIMQLFDDKADSDYLAKTVDNTDIATNDYNLSVSAYVEAEDTREVIDITTLNAELKITVAKINQLRADINTIVAEIEA